MKNFFKKKKNLVGIIGIIASIIIGAVLIPLSGEGSIANLSFWHFLARFISLSMVATILSFTLLMIFGQKVFWFYFVIMECFMIFTTIAEFTSQGKLSFNFLRIIIALALLSFLLYYAWKIYNYNNLKINGKLKENESKEAKEQLMALLEEDAKLKVEIKYLEKSIIVANQMGTIFQLIKGEEKYYFNFLGTVLSKGIDETRCVKDFTNLDEIEKLHKKNYSININQIEDLLITLRVQQSLLTEYGLLKIKAEGKTRRYSFINEMEEQEIKEFFGDTVAIKKKEQVKEEEPLTSKAKKDANLANKILLCYTCVASLIFTVYMFFDYAELHHVLTIICALLTFVPLVLYIKFQNCLELRDTPRYQQEKAGGKISILFQSIIFACLFALKQLILCMDLIAFSWLRFLVYSLALFAVLFLILVFTTKEHKKFKSVFVSFVLILFLLCPSVVIGLNSSVDLSTKQIVCEVVEKPTHTDNNNEVTYYLTIKMGNRNYRNEVSKEIYDKYDLNGEVIVVEHNGLLGIDYFYLQDYDI